MNYSLRDESRIYAQHVLCLVLPGRRVPVLEVHPNEPDTIDDWDSDDFKLLIEEGRRQLDRQLRDLERIQNRSQFLFTTALGLLVLAVATAKQVANRGNVIVFCAWILALGLIVLSILGAAALMTVRSDLGMIDTALATSLPRPVDKALAAAHARAVRPGENTVATRLTVYRDAVYLLIVGAAFFAGAWLATTI